MRRLHGFRLGGVYKQFPSIQGELQGRFWEVLDLRTLLKRSGAPCIYIYIYIGPGGEGDFFKISNTKNQFLDLQRAPRRSQEGLESSGGPVRIICTKFRPISMVHERAMTKNPRGGRGVGVLYTKTLLKPTQNLPKSAQNPGRELY